MKDLDRKLNGIMEEVYSEMNAEWEHDIEEFNKTDLSKEIMACKTQEELAAMIDKLYPEMASGDTVVI